MGRRWHIGTWSQRICLSTLLITLIWRSQILFSLRLCGNNPKHLLAQLITWALKSTLKCRTNPVKPMSSPRASSSLIWSRGKPHSRRPPMRTKTIFGSSKKTLKLSGSKFKALLIWTFRHFRPNSKALLSSAWDWSLQSAHSSTSLNTRPGIVRKRPVWRRFIKRWLGGLEFWRSTRRLT